MALPATEDFAGASGVLGASWTQQATTGRVGRDGSGAGTLTTTVAIDTLARWNADAFGNDQYAKFTIKALTTDTAYCELQVRASADTGDSAFDGYYSYMDGSSTLDHCGVGVFVNGTFNAVFSLSQAISVNDVMQLEASGSTITLKRNGSTIGSTTDSTRSSGSAGCGGYWGSAAAPKWDDWEGGNLGGAASQFPEDVLHRPALMAILAH